MENEALARNPRLRTPDFTAEELLNEEWLEVPGFQGRYSVSNLGRIRRERLIKRGTVKQRMLSGHSNRQGYRMIFLRSDDGDRRYSIHSLVALTFIGPRPTGYHINHKDGNPANNRLENLEYVTPLENTRHGLDVLGYREILRQKARTRWALGDPGFTKHKKVRGEKHPNGKLTNEQVEEIRAAYMRGGVTHHSLAKQYGVTSPYICNLIKRRRRAYVQ